MPALRRWPSWTAALLAAAWGCAVNESGNIRCLDDSNCPQLYPQCIRSAGAAEGRCTEAVIGTPELGSGGIAVAPGAVSGGERPSLSLGLPALVAGKEKLARKVTLGVSSGGV